MSRAQPWKLKVVKPRCLRPHRPCHAVSLDLKDAKAKRPVLGQKEYRERVKALMDAIGERERERDEREEWTAEWSAEWLREQRRDRPHPFR